MSDTFWGAFFVALPAMLAALLAYRKSEKAEARAEFAQAIAGVCKYVPCVNVEKSTLPVGDQQQVIADLQNRISLLEEKVKVKDNPAGVEWK